MTLSFRVLFNNHTAYRCFSLSRALASDHSAIAKTFIQPHIDLEKKLEEITKLKENVERRKLQIDPEKLKSLWDFLKYLELTKVQLEKRKTEIAYNMKDLKKIGNDGEAKQEMEKLKVEGRIVREDLKTLMKAFWEVEEKVILKGLTLPNELHKDTPDHTEHVIHQFKENPNISQKRDGHIEIGQALGLIDFKNPSFYYLKNDAAIFELSCISYFSEGLKADDFIHFCNPDFARSIIVEGCRVDHSDPSVVFTVAQPIEKSNPNYRLHLVGGASIYPFCAFHTKQMINFSSLPLKYYASGRQYSPSENAQEHCLGLFNTWQRTSLEIFILTADDYVEMMSVFRKTLETVIRLYERLDYHFRVTYIDASSLQSWECLRASIQMFSCHRQKYIEVGKISISDKYICQRLLMSYQMSEKDEKTRFMKMVSGTIVDVPKLLGCLLEERGSNDKKFSIPDCLKDYGFA